MRAPDLQGGASARERYIFETVGVPPTNAADISQATVEAGIPEPTATNAGAASIMCSVRGRLRQDAPFSPTIAIKVQDLGAIPAVDAASLIERALTAGGADVTSIIGAATRPLPSRVLGVPRFSVQRTDYDFLGGSYADSAHVGVRDTWSRFPSASSVLTAVPPGGSSTWQVRGAPSWVEAPDGSLLIAFAVGRVDASAFGLITARYAPWESQSFVVVSGCSTSNIGTFLGSATFIPNDCEVIARGDDIYALVCGQLGLSGSSLVAVIQLYSPSSSAAALRKIALPTVFATAAPARVSASVMPDGTVVAALQASSQIQMMASQDLRTWTSYAGSAAVVQLTDASIVRWGVGGIQDISMVSSTDGWACGATGNIFRTRDGGKAWEEVDAPTTYNNTLLGTFHAISSIAATSTYQVAVGENGLIMRRGSATSDVWKVLRYDRSVAAKKFASGYLEAAASTSTDVPVVTLRKARLISNRLWIVGDQSLILYCADISAATPTFTTIQHNAGAGPYYDFVVDAQGSGNTLIAVGDVTTHNVDAITASDRKARAMLITNADGSGAHVKKYISPQADAADGDRIVSITAETTTAYNLTGARGYILTDLGRVFRWDGNTGTATVDFTQLADLRWPRLNYSGDIHTFAAGKIRIIGPSLPVDPSVGLVWACDNATAGSPAFTSQLVPRFGRALHFIDADNAIVGGDNAFIRIGAAQNSRKLGNMLTTADGTSVFLCAYNGTRTRLEVYRAAAPAAGAIPAFQIAYTASLATDQRPCLCELDDGTILMTYGQTSVFGRNGGREWVLPTDASLPVPLASLASGSGFTLTDGSIYGGRATIGYGGGRLFTAVPRERGSADMDAIGIFTAWEFDAAGAYYRPLVPGVPADIGVDGLRVIFTGDPQPGDSWTIRPRYAYGVRNIVSDSPSASEWRSGAWDAIPDPQIIEWDRQEADVIAELGDGEFWNVTAFALFGTNFPTAVFKISDPSNVASFTTYTLNNSLASGNGTFPGGTTSATATSIIVDTSKSWTPGRWNQGTRQYYARFTGILGLPCFKIVRSGTNWFEIEGSVTLSSAPLQPYVIFGDRFAWFGEGGSAPGSAGLRDSNKYRFGQIVGIEIPTANTAEGYLKIGKAMIGHEPKPDTAGRSFGYGMSYRLVPQATEDRGLSGVSSVRHFGRTAQVWTIQHRAQTPDERDRELSELAHRGRRPFAIAWIGNDHDSIELVRVVDAPSVSNALKANRFDSEWALVQVP